MEEKYSLLGIFYSRSNERFEGRGYTDGREWYVNCFDGRKIKAKILFLDRDKRILAPNSEGAHRRCTQQAKNYFFKYSEEVRVLEECENLKVSTSYKMKLNMAKAYKIEYKKIYLNLSGSTVLKVIFRNF